MSVLSFISPPVRTCWYMLYTCIVINRGQLIFLINRARKGIADQGLGAENEKLGVT
jgi:hypothetical protein